MQVAPLPGPLTAEEWREVQRQPELAAALLSDLGTSLEEVNKAGKKDA